MRQIRRRVLGVHGTHDAHPDRIRARTGIKWGVRRVGPVADAGHDRHTFVLGPGLNSPRPPSLKGVAEARRQHIQARPVLGRNVLGHKVLELVDVRLSVGNGAIVDKRIETRGDSPGISAKENGTDRRRMRRDARFERSGVEEMQVGRLEAVVFCVRPIIVLRLFGLVVGETAAHHAEAHAHTAQARIELTQGVDTCPVKPLGLKASAFLGPRRRRQTRQQGYDP